MCWHNDKYRILEFLTLFLYMNVCIELHSNIQQYSTITFVFYTIVRHRKADMVVRLKNNK